jgi:alpha-L-fucosidase 2
MGWKVNLWARALDGDHAHIILKNALKHSTSYGTDQYKGGIYYNLFDSHAPFQIDGNFGVCAGVAELLLQSHTDTIHLLPALPSVWSKGTISGLKAVGNFTVSIDWNDCKATKATIRNIKGEACHVKYAGVNRALVTVNGKEINVSRLTKDVCHIPSQAGDEIVIDFTQSPTGIVSPEEETETDVAVYDLMGRKIERPTQRGIYIKKGEKYIAR